MAAAFLFKGDHVIMMQKSRSFVDGEFWTGLGGHLEEEELGWPSRACIREIFEESGIREEQIIDLQLRYILLRLKETEIRQQYIYFGRTDCEQLLQSEEGELHWIHRDQLSELRLSRIVAFMLEDYLKDPECGEIRVGTITAGMDGQPAMQWSQLRDPNVF